MTTHIYIRGEKGGSGSGNWGHAGRPGLVGGSGGGGMVIGAGQPSGGDDANQFLNDIVDDYGTPGGENWLAASQAEREGSKRTIVSELAQRSGVDDAIVNEVIKQWAGTSNDADIQSLSLQEAAAEELGLKLSNWQQENIDTVRQSILALDPSYRELHTPITSRANERAIIRAMYDNTQEQLAKAGYASGDTIALVRGITYGDSDPGRAAMSVVDYKGNSMESWTVSDRVAMDFATGEGNYDNYGEVVSMAVPVSSIIGTARTGFGCLTEGEFVIAGNVPGSKATVWETIKPYDAMTEDERVDIFGGAGLGEEAAWGE